MLQKIIIFINNLLFSNCLKLINYLFKENNFNKVKLNLIYIFYLLLSSFFSLTIQSNLV